MSDRPSLDYRRPALLGLLGLAVLAGGGVAWASVAEISGAVIASGAVVVEGKPQSVQHLDGGVVSALFVTDGDHVEKDQVLIELDDTMIAANLSIYEGRLREAIVRKARLIAELNGEDSFEAPVELAQSLGLGDLASAVEQQSALLQARRLTLESELEQLDERIAQYGNQMIGVNGLIDEKDVQTGIYDDEIAAIGSLVQRGYASRTRLMALQRAQADLRGQVAEHRAEVARLENSISETRIAKLQAQREFRERVVSEIEENDTEVDELRQQMEATREQLGRVAIRAPVSGMVHELSLFTIGGVVQPGETVMQIISQSREHEIELNVETTAIDQIFLGQQTAIRFPAFHQRTTPELHGEVASISPSSVIDEATGLAFYRIAVEISDEELARLGDKALIPGMPVEAFIATEQRTVISYLVKPLIDQLHHTFREE